MLSINGLHNFYYLPELHDMRCKAQRIAEIIRGRYHRDPLNGDVYMFMSRRGEELQARTERLERMNVRLDEIMYELKKSGKKIDNLLKTVDIRSPKTVISVHFSSSKPMAMQIY